MGTLASPLLSSEASAINSQGQVVGKYRHNTYTDHAFLWTPNGMSGKMIDLNQLLSAVEQVQWTLVEATGINDSGQIVGNGLFDPDGPGGPPALQRGFLLTLVPEPHTLVLISVLITIVSGRRLRRREGE